MLSRLSAASAPAPSIPHHRPPPPHPPPPAGCFYQILPAASTGCLSQIPCTGAPTSSPASGETGWRPPPRHLSQKETQGCVLTGKREENKWRMGRERKGVLGAGRGVERRGCGSNKSQTRRAGAQRDERDGKGAGGPLGRANGRAPRGPGVGQESALPVGDW